MAKKKPAAQTDARDARHSADELADIDRTTTAPAPAEWQTPAPAAAHQGASAGGAGMSKMDAVRAALAEDSTLTGNDLSAFILKRYGIEIDSKMAGVYRSNVRKQQGGGAGAGGGKRGGGRKKAAAAQGGAQAPATAAVAQSQPRAAAAPTLPTGSISGAMESIRLLTAQFGADEVARLAQMFSK